MALYKLLESGRINHLLFLYKLTKSESIYNRVDKLVERKVQRIQNEVVKSRWERIRLQEELDDLKK